MYTSLLKSLLFQALFSLVIWPFSLKLLWAPLLDSLYFKKIGKRKSWLIPIQYLIGKSYIIFIFIIIYFISYIIVFII